MESSSKILQSYLVFGGVKGTPKKPTVRRCDFGDSNTSSKGVNGRPGQCQLPPFPPNSPRHRPVNNHRSFLILSKVSKEGLAIFPKKKNGHVWCLDAYPIPSMGLVYLPIHLVELNFMANVGKYTIHGSYGDIGMSCWLVNGCQS